MYFFNLPIKRKHWVEFLIHCCLSIWSACDPYEIRLRSSPKFKLSAVIWLLALCSSAAFSWRHSVHQNIAKHMEMDFELERVRHHQHEVTHNSENNERVQGALGVPAGTFWSRANLKRMPWSSELKNHSRKTKWKVRRELASVVGYNCMLLQGLNCFLFRSYICLILFYVLFWRCIT